MVRQWRISELELADLGSNGGVNESEFSGGK